MDPSHPDIHPLNLSHSISMPPDPYYHLLTKPRPSSPARCILCFHSHATRSQHTLSITIHDVRMHAPHTYASLPVFAEADRVMKHMDTVL